MVTIIPVMVIIDVDVCPPLGSGYKDSLHSCDNDVHVRESGPYFVRCGTRKLVHVWPLSLAGITLFSPTTMFSSNSRPPSQHTHSINAVKHTSYFGSVDEEMRDCKRVQRQGQEEDLREALSRMMTRVEEMVRYHRKSSPLSS